MKALSYLTLYLFLAVLLIGCGGKDDNQDKQPDKPQATVTNTPLSDQDRLATAAVQSQQTPTEIIPTPTITPAPTQSYDPGPYFTPRRSSPPDPATFIPDEQIGEFTRVDLDGNCQRNTGQVSHYTKPEGGDIFLTCQFMASPNAAYNVIVGIPTNVLTGDPIVTKLQGSESFVLGASGNSFLYAWTHGRWLFMARSPQGRELLDEFMQVFPY